MSDNNSSNYTIGRLIYFLISIGTAIIGYKIHGSVFWSVVDFFFWGIAWIKWLVCQEVNITIIKSAFSFFFN